MANNAGAPAARGEPESQASEAQRWFELMLLDADFMRDLTRLVEAHVARLQREQGGKP